MSRKQDSELEQILAESRAFFAAVERRGCQHRKAGMCGPDALELAIDEELEARHGMERETEREEPMPEEIPAAVPESA